MSARVLVIDDLEPAMNLLTGFGRSLIEPSVELLRDTLGLFTDRMRWDVVRHSSFSQWIEDECDSAQNGQAAVLDPLIEARAGVRCAVRYSRKIERAGALVTLGIVGRPMANRCRFDTVIDDAASSGRTLRHFAEVQRSQGGELRRIFLCAASSGSYSYLRRADVRAQWRAFIPGDWRVIHLRDAFPFLPFAGRFSGILRRGLVPDLEFRTPPSQGVSAIWTAVYAGTKVSDAIERARVDIVKALGHQLDRAATVQDIEQLGHGVPLSCAFDERITVSTELRSFL